MKLSTKSRYAIMAMADIASHRNNLPIRLAEISERQEIALNYLEQIFSHLKKSGLVSSVRGPGGGYKINKDTSELYISDILTAVSPHIKMTRCNGEQNCIKNSSKCLTHKLWVGLENNIMNYLSSVSLEDIVAGSISIPSLKNTQRFIEVS